MRRPIARDQNQRKRNATTLTASWVNADPAFLQPYAWFDASDTSTITESGGFVSQWNDKSGNSRNLSQAVGINQPLTGSVTLNGLNTILFDGSNDRLVGAANSVNFTQMSVFAVLRHSGFGASNAPRFFEITNRGFIGLNVTATASMQMFISTNATAMSVRTQDNTFTTNTWRSVSLVWPGGLQSANSYLRIGNSDQVVTAVEGTGTLPSTLNLRLVAGNREAGDRPWPGEIAELIIFDRAITIQGARLIQQYFNSKWGV